LNGWPLWRGGTGKAKTVITAAFWHLLLAGGGGAVVVLATLKFFGQRFVDASIARGMESQRHRNIREIEEMKFAFQRNFDRRTRIVQTELEIIPQIWALFLQATNKTKAAQARFRIVTDLAWMSKEDLIEWLSGTVLSKAQQTEIVKAQPSDRNQLYSRADDIRLCHEARTAAFEARNFLAVNAVLIPTQLYQEFFEFSKMIDDAAFDAEFEAVHGRIPKEDRRSDNFWKNSDETIVSLSLKVRNLLTDGMVQLTKVD
jgi:hypothetical protein